MAPTPEPAAPQAHILVIDDEPLVAGSIERTLRANRFAVTVANSGVEGLSAARRHAPDLVVLDMVMPGVDGLEVCRQLRADPLLGDVPVLFLTARGKPEDRVQGLRAGADDYLAKPFNIDEFILRILAILRRRAPRPAAASPHQLRVRDLVLDIRTYVVSGPRGEASLTPVQFDLLYFLMSHPGEVFAPAKLLRDVWDYPFDAGSPDLVRVHIKNLRDKIEADPARPQYVTTVVGHGYTIQP
jgi:two-component system alkaline phosphatase synthesis response regulator PhoP/two-component system response regulator RpaA